MSFGGQVAATIFRPAKTAMGSRVHGSVIRAFSGKVDTGFPSENATNKEQLERFPIQPDPEAL
jgi:hypothetical protein